MWTYRQSSGQVEDFKGLIQSASSYAGHGEGKNNPILQYVHGGCKWDDNAKDWAPIEGLTADDWGPLPCGIYILLTPVDTPAHGPFVMWLAPHSDNQMFGRSGFGWHGDSIEHPGLASDGCICSPRALRQLAWNSNDHTLQVIP